MDMHDGQAAARGDADTETDLQARVAWFYYVSNLTQQEIADRLGLTRARVNRLLAAGHQSGLLQITINSAISSCVELERGLVAHYGLEDAVVVPTPDTEALVRDAIGVGAGTWLAKALRDGDTIAMGWGRTLRSVIRSFPKKRLSSAAVVSLQGGLSHCSSINTFELVWQLAEKIGADRYFFAAPIYASSEGARDTILEQDAIRETYEKAVAADLALVTVGDMDESLVVSYGLAEPGQADALKAAGAVGDMLGHFLDAGGALVDHPMNRRTVAISLSDLRRIRRLVLVSGGVRKLAITRAALRGGYVKVLVTDEDSAGRLLAD
ncbi:sugar-binding transcriptional regulator [Arenibaculum pallidiluteum]|uniref:sugar-binding transcriptional regulator n=1 Tax=Arenibaculum pallidiluteum TaxID=2812559 RepID=UPI001A964500|nr:sugar-binding transcriptional regulator [Arenibaculum pallidiluteum]